MAALGILVSVSSLAQTASNPYKVLRTAKVGGEGGYDYVYADAAGRKLYVPRMGPSGRIAVYDLDTLKPVGEIAKTNAHGVAVDEASRHAFGSSKPVAMWDAETLAPIKTIEVRGEPDGILDDAYNGRIYVLSHEAPNATVIDAKTGSVVGTIDLGGEPEQAVSDGKGTLYIDLEDKGSIAVVDAKTLKVKGAYDLQGKGAGCAGLAMDEKNGILFAACRKPQTMVVLSAADGKILETLPIGSGTDGAAFNPKTMEALATHGEGTLTVVKENSPAGFSVEQTLKTLPRARTIAFDSKTGRIFTITAEFGPPPPPAPGEKWSRAPMIPGTFEILEIGK
jgi:YVTN family beta-propeller protein